VFNWHDHIHLPKKDSNVDYAFLLKQSPDLIIAENEDQFNKQVEDNWQDILYISTPEEKGFILWGTSPKYVERLTEWKIDKKQRSFYIRLLLYLFFMIILFLGTDGTLGLVLLGLIPVVDQLSELSRLKKLSRKTYNEEFDNIRFWYWLKKHQSFTLAVLPVAFVLCFFFPHFNGLDLWNLLTPVFFIESSNQLIFAVSALFGLGALLIPFIGFLRFLVLFLLFGLVSIVAGCFVCSNSSTAGFPGAFVGFVVYFLIITIRFKNIFSRQLFGLALASVIYAILQNIFIFNVWNIGIYLGGAFVGLLFSVLIPEKEIVKIVVKNSRKKASKIRCLF